MSEELAKKLNFPRKIGLAAKREVVGKKMAEIKPEECLNRIAIVFDDSGSMGGKPLEDAKKAVSGFTGYSNPLETSISVYPMNREAKPLINDYGILNAYVQGVRATGGTPLYSTLTKAIAEQPLTRLVIFSDGAPTDSGTAYLSEDDVRKGATNFVGGDVVAALDHWRTSPQEKAIALMQKAELPADTVFIGEGAAGDRDYDTMKMIADRTGGIFMHFKDTSIFGTALRYLAPGYRAMLMNPDVKARIERGEKI